MSTSLIIENGLFERFVSHIPHDQRTTILNFTSVQIQVAALKFFLGTDEADGEESDSDDDDDGQVSKIEPIQYLLYYVISCRSPYYKKPLMSH